MKVADLSAEALAGRLRGPGLRLRTGPVVSSIRSAIPAVVDAIALHYAEHPVLDDDGGFSDFHVSVDRPATLRRWLRPQVEFRLDGNSAFEPLPGDQGFPMLEWGMNWCVSGLYHRFLILHAAVIERGGRALILPAPSGSGKSTLCAGLIFRGWRLMSDELTLIDPADLSITPLPRPVSLKNASIDVIRAFAPEARFGTVVSETIKGRVCHFRPPVSAVEQADTPARPRWIVLPRYVADAPAALRPLGRGRAVMHLIENAFNYNVHGPDGFTTLADVVDRCDCYEFSYGRLDDAVAVFDRLAAESGPPSPS